MKYVTGMIYGILLATVLISCNNDIISSAFINESSFTESQNGWVVSAVDYDTLAGRDSLKLSSQIASFPSPLPLEGKALLIRSTNIDSSLFTFITKKIIGLQTGQSYAINLEADLILRYPQDDSLDFITTSDTRIFLKAAVANVGPEISVIDAKTHLNLDKGKLGESGDDFIVLTDQVFPNNIVYKSHSIKSTGNILTTKPDANGNIWVYLGTETAFKGQTQVYYDRIKITIEAIEQND